MPWPTLDCLDIPIPSFFLLHKELDETTIRKTLVFEF